MKSRYKKIKLKDGSTIDEHRKIMQEHLGRKLGFNEVVHHVDGNKMNNSIENLELMSRSDHTSMHMRESPNIHYPTEIEKQHLRETFRGEGSTSSKLSDPQIVCMKRLFAIGMSGAAAGRIFNIGQWQCNAIKRGDRWSHVTI